MGIISNCLKWSSEHCKCVKFDRAKTALTVCGVIAVLLVIALIVATVAPDFINDMYTFGNTRSSQVLVGYNISIGIMLLANILLFFGLIHRKGWLLFIWIIIMTTFWNIHLAVGIVSIVNYIVGGEERQLAKTPTRSLALILVQVFWLLGIALIWFHWRTLMKLNDDIPNLVEFIRERSSASAVNSPERSRQVIPRSTINEQPKEQEKLTKN